MEQSHIIERVTELFAEKLKKIDADENRFHIIIDDDTEIYDDKQPALKIILLGIEENHSNNMFEKIKQSEIDEDGNLIEYFIQPATLINLRYMVAPYCSSRNTAYRMLGMIIKQIKDDNLIEIDEYDWIDNNMNPIKIENIQIDFEKQIQIFNLLRIDFKPSLFYQMTVGINSDKKEMFRRVEERKISAKKI
ncbi:MAG: Pvc16 family protein [Spirochaetota bacterium]|nr:Pvc16 family protein [Spirochaetota bacterium]